MNYFKFISAFAAIVALFTIPACSTEEDEPKSVVESTSDSYSDEEVLAIYASSHKASQYGLSRTVGGEGSDHTVTFNNLLSMSYDKQIEKLMSLSVKDLERLSNEGKQNYNELQVQQYETYQSNVIDYFIATTSTSEVVSVFDFSAEYCKNMEEDLKPKIVMNYCSNKSKTIQTIIINTSVKIDVVQPFIAVDPNKLLGKCEAQLRSDLGHKLGFTVLTEFLTTLSSGFVAPEEAAIFLGVDLCELIDIIYHYKCCKLSLMIH